MSGEFSLNERSVEVGELEFNAAGAGSGSLKVLMRG